MKASSPDLGLTVAAPIVRLSMEVYEEAAKIRLIERQKEEELQRKYGTYVDSEPYLLSSATPEIPAGIERFELLALIKDLSKREEKAINTARIYRDQCNELKIRCRELEEEKEGIRYFWRNKIMEEQSRSGKMIKLAVCGQKL